MVSDEIVFIIQGELSNVCVCVSEFWEAQYYLFS